MRYLVEMVTRSSKLVRTGANGWGNNLFHDGTTWLTGVTQTAKVVINDTTNAIRFSIGPDIGPTFAQDFTIICNDLVGGQYRILEGNTQVWPAVGQTAFSSGDDFEIKQSGLDVITFYQNGIFKYTSSTTPTFVAGFGLDYATFQPAIIDKCQVGGTSLTTKTATLFTRTDEVVIDDELVADMEIFFPHVDLLMDIFVHRFAVDVISDMLLSASDYDEHDYESFRDGVDGEDYHTNDPFFKELITDMAVKELGRLGPESLVDMRLKYDTGLGKTFGEIFTEMDMRLLSNPQLLTLVDIKIIKQVTKNIVMDMVLNQTGTVDVPTDINIVNRFNITTVLDTILKSLGVEITSEIDTIIKKFGETIILQSDMTLKSFGKEHEELVDMLVKKVFEIATPTDLKIVSRVELTEQIDLLVRSTTQLSLIADLVTITGPFTPDKLDTGKIRRELESIGIIRRSQEDIGRIRREMENTGTLN